MASSAQPAEAHMPGVPLGPIEAQLVVAIEGAKAAGARSFLAGDLDAVTAGVERVRSLQALRVQFQSFVRACHELGVELDVIAKIPPPVPAAEDAEQGLPSSVEERGEVEVPRAEPEIAVDVAPSQEPTPIAAPAVEPATPKPALPEQTPSRPFEPRRKAFFDAASEILDLSSRAPLTGEEIASLKRVVCLGRELLVDPTIGERSQVVRQELELLRHAYNAHATSPFFGFQGSRSPSADAWLDAAEAYGLLASALAAEKVLETGPAALSPEVRRSLLDAAAAAETYLYRVIYERNLQGYDAQQRELNDRLRAEALRQNVYLPYWKSPEDGGPATANLLRVAKTLPKLLAEAVEAPARDRRKRQSLQALTSLVADPLSAAGDFEDELVARALACLDAGLTPSKRELVAALVPFHSILADAGEPRLHRLTQAVNAMATLALRSSKNPTKKVFAIQAEKSLDPETSSKLEELRTLLRGKVALFVGGGNKGDHGRRAEIEKALGLSELIWPDSDKTTPVARFEADAARADLVCKVVLQARTGYKAIVKEAKSKGKMGAYLTKGLGLNLVVYDLHRQLVRPLNLPA